MGDDEDFDEEAERAREEREQREREEEDAGITRDENGELDVPDPDYEDWGRSPSGATDDEPD